MLRHLYLLISILHIVEGKAFGHTMEYRFEYDPRKSDKPNVEWRYDDLLGRKTGYSDETTTIRKAPQKFPQIYVNENEYPIRTNIHRNGWYSAPAREEKEEKMDHQVFVEEMAAELRRRSEEIIASHFPNFPFHFYGQPQQQNREEWYPEQYNL